MTLTREQIQIAYKKLPPDIQDLIMSSETTELITNAIKEARVPEEQADLADSEILYALFCLQSLDDTINNIAKLSNIDVSSLLKLKSTVKDNILNKFKIDIKELIEANKSELVAQTSVPEIAPAILPIVEEGEIAHTVPHVEQPPITPKQGQVPPPDYRYPDGKDPYRELPK